MSRVSPDADGQQTEWRVHYARVGKRGTDRKYYDREWTARRYANRLAEQPDKYSFVDLQKRPVGEWRFVERIYPAPIKAIDWDEAWAYWERKKNS